MTTINPNFFNPAVNLSADKNTSSIPVKAENAEASPQASDSFTVSSNDKPQNQLKASDLASLKTVNTAKIESVLLSENTVEKALDAFSTTGKVASSCISGASGTIAGVTIDNLKNAQSEIEKGYHLPENYLASYYQRRILPYQQNPKYTQTDNEHLYRGMYITVDDLANIMDKGLEVKYNQWSAAGGKGVYFSTSIREADDYIFQSISNDKVKNNAIGVVVETERDDYAEAVIDPVLNSTETIYKAANDVPKEKITDILIRGEYGLESLKNIIDKAENGEIKDNSTWVNQFDRGFLR